MSVSFLPFSERKINLKQTSMLPLPLNDSHLFSDGLSELEDLSQTLQHATVKDLTDEDLSHWASSLEKALRLLRHHGGGTGEGGVSGIGTSQSSSHHPSVPRTAPTGGLKIARGTPATSTKSIAPPREREPSTFPTALDRNKKGPRLLTHPISQATHQKIKNCAIAILAVLESVLNQINCDAVSLAAPYRGHDYEFRCLCAISRDKPSEGEGGTGEPVGGDCMAFAGSGIIRGKDSVEYAAYSSGYIINTCPKAVLLLGEDAQGDAECMSLMELMGDPYRRHSFMRGMAAGGCSGSRSTNGASAASGSSCHGPSVARLCCPAKSSASSAPLGLVTVTLEGGLMFNAEAENYLFDAATTIGTLLARCVDLSALQACFAKGNLRDELPAFTPKLVDIPDPRIQLVYRISNMTPSTPSPTAALGTVMHKEKSAAEPSPPYPSSTHPLGHPSAEGDGGCCASQTTSVRLVSPDTGKVEKLREGSPLKNVLGYMERLQLSWFAAVRLNVELKQKCEAQDRYLSIFLQQNRAPSASS